MRAPQAAPQHENKDSMAYVISDNIMSPLGLTSRDNYLAVRSGHSALSRHDPPECGMPHSFTAALMYGGTPFDGTPGLSAPSRFDALLAASVSKAVAQAGIDVSDSGVAFIVSSTKGAVEEGEPLAASAARVAAMIGFASQPIVVCNACISGVAALTLAARMIDAGIASHAVVAGCDVPRHFVVSGFQSLNAMSASECRPFDIDRCGLNLGEAAATMVLGREPFEGAWQIGCGYVRNDAYHTTAPSRTADGLLAAIQATLCGVDTGSLAFVNAHGTATLFNDQMESVAIARAGLSDVPLNALKGYFGHTLGAAGVIETIISMHAAADGTVIGTRGYAERGVSRNVNISPHNRHTDKNTFVKMLSGFGGCNATLMATRGNLPNVGRTDPQTVGLRVAHTVHLTPLGATVDGDQVPVGGTHQGQALLTALYRDCVAHYPKYFKMDALCRLGFIASELLLQAEGKQRFVPRDDRAVVLFNNSSSVCSDRKYAASAAAGGGQFPSPSLFVYTLPNIVAGEIAIRNAYRGETSFYILQGDNRAQTDAIIRATLADAHTRSLITGWIDCPADNDFEARLSIVEAD